MARAKHCLRRAGESGHLVAYQDVFIDMPETPRELYVKVDKSIQAALDVISRVEADENATFVAIVPAEEGAVHLFRRNGGAA